MEGFLLTSLYGWCSKRGKSAAVAKKRVFLMSDCARDESLGYGLGSMSDIRVDLLDRSTKYDLQNNH